MADSYSIEAPVTLFQLSASGQKQAGSSHSISGGKKRKRTEIVLGSDGESVNVYDIKAPRLIISHPIPPQAHLTAPPCSVHLKSSTSKSSTRYTYAALINELRPKRQEIVAFSYTATKAQELSTTGAGSSQSSWKSSEDHGAIVKLEVVPAGESHELIAIHKSGKLRGFSNGAVQQFWEHEVEGSVEVDHAFVQSAAEARQGLLKNREDLLGVLGSNGEGQDNIENQTAIITLIASDLQTGARSVYVLAVDPPTPGSIARISSRVRTLITWSLEEATADTKKHVYSFDKTSGTLFDLADDQLSTYTFTILGPQLARKIPQLPDSATVDAFLPLPRSLVLMSTPSTSVIVNTQYSSILASRNATSSDVAAQSSKKRKHDGTNGIAKTSSVRLFDYFRTLNLAIGIQGSALIAFQLRFPSVVRGRGTGAAKQESRMIESLGKGIPSKSEGTRQAIPAIDAAAVDEVAQSDPSLVKLAELFVASSNEPAPYVSLDGLARSLRWILRSFSTPSINAQQKTTSPDEPPTKKLKPNGINGTHTTDSAETDASEELIRREEEKANADLSLAVALITASSQSPTESPNARAQTLHALLTRLGTHFTSSATALSHSLRAHLSRHDLFLLIELLRHALEQGGWASKTLDVYPSDSDDEEEATPEDIGGIDSSVRVIGTLISAAIDALGAGAWLTGGVDVSVDNSTLTPSGSEDGNDEPKQNQMLLPTLRHLTASVLEVTQEAAFFRHFLADFLRYADALASAPMGVQNRLSAMRAENERNVLPMGVRGARGISETTVRAGGEVRVRSKRDLADKIQRGVGVYGFERMRV